MIYQVEKGYKTPFLFIDTDAGIFRLSGRCISEFPADFFTVFIKHLEEYKKKPKNETTFNVSIEYANTSSTKCILDILK